MSFTVSISLCMRGMEGLRSGAPIAGLEVSP
jgi:hypothetical protein